MPKYTFQVYNKTRDTLVAERGWMADNMARRVVGLLAHSSMEPGTGLIIIPCNSIHSIGMRFLFDAVFLSPAPEYKVLHLIREMKPWRLSKMVFAAESVLELPAGVISATGTQIGDILEVRPIEPEQKPSSGEIAQAMGTDGSSAQQ
ncbi:MAG TPA: DUF192 domain-containing protein [Candidatus Methylacidiphilales bacterium]|nr:DUF192 domain-containing protein [Candidatus Methylacidiphilales bacterium]